ncbi:MAG: hypothetical protein ACR2RE_29155, partial [Geminicoccaceae bacterium]
MVSALREDDLSIRLGFGAGLATRASSDQIQPAECADGQNFALDVGNTEFVPRKPFKLLATAPNGSPIRGFAQLIKADGTTSMLVQAGTAVYSWSGTAFGASVGTVSAAARLRGRLEHNFTLDEKVLITDLGLQENVKEWDGTTLQDVPFTGVTNLKAKYCFVSNERAFFGNLSESGTALPHVLAATKRSDRTVADVTSRPASGIAIDDPFQLPAPDLRPINGLVEAFDVIAVSTDKGNLYKVLGESAKTDETGLIPYSIDSLYPRSGASGQESLTFVGNDIVYGRPGRIE